MKFTPILLPILLFVGGLQAMENSLDSGNSSANQTDASWSLEQICTFLRPNIQDYIERHLDRSDPATWNIDSLLSLSEQVTGSTRTVEDLVKRPKYVKLCIEHKNVDLLLYCAKQNLISHINTVKFVGTALDVATQCFHAYIKSPQARIDAENKIINPSVCCYLIICNYYNNYENQQLANEDKKPYKTLLKCCDHHFVK